jgi:hypothetical protein
MLSANKDQRSRSNKEINKDDDINQCTYIRRLGGVANEEVVGLGESKH